MSVHVSSLALLLQFKLNEMQSGQEKFVETYASKEEGSFCEVKMDGLVLLLLLCVFGSQLPALIYLSIYLSVGG